MLCQVVPAQEGQQWISGRQTAACGLVGDDMLLTMGGFGPSDQDGHNLLTTFAFTPGPALALHTSLSKQGAHFLFLPASESSSPEITRADVARRDAKKADSKIDPKQDPINSGRGAQ